MCTYTNASGKPYRQKGKAYDVFDERLACIHNSYGPTIVRVGLGQGIPSFNPSVDELKRQLRHVTAANLSKLAGNKCNATHSPSLLSRQLLRILLV